MQNRYAGKITTYILMAAAGFFCVLDTVYGLSDLQVSVKKQAETYVAAYMRKDYDACMKMMGAKIIDALGGKIDVLNHFDATKESLKRHDLKLETITMSDPGPLIKCGKEWYMVIPEQHRLVKPDSREYILNSYILAVSEDNGVSWSMLEGSWRISEHIKNHDLVLYDRLHLPTREIYLADDPNIVYLEKGGAFITPPQTYKYKQTLRQRDNPPPPQPTTPGY